MVLVFLLAITRLCIASFPRYVFPRMDVGGLDYLGSFFGLWSIRSNELEYLNKVCTQ